MGWLAHALRPLPVGVPAVPVLVLLLVLGRGEVFDNVHTGFLAGDDYEQAARLRAQDQATSEAESNRLVELVTDAPPEVLGRLALAVAAQHEPGPDGYCRICAECQPRRWRWWRRAPEPWYPCPTRRVMVTELRAAPSGPRFTPA